MVLNSWKPVLDAGASAILTDEEGELILKGLKIDALIVKKDARRALAQAVLSFHGRATRDNSCNYWD